MNKDRSISTRPLSDSCLKSAVTVSAMARMVSLSRSRFYSLVEQGIFPGPVYLIRTRRPVYTTDLQQTCLNVRQQGIGFVTGEPILFYEPRGSSKGQSISLARKKQSKAKDIVPVLPEFARIIDGLKQLGMSDVKPTDATKAIADCFPDGAVSVEPGAVLAAVYRRLRASK